MRWSRRLPRQVPGDATVERAVKRVEAIKQMPPLLMVEDGHNGQDIFADPLYWWVSRARVGPAFLKSLFDSDRKSQLPIKRQCGAADLLW